jgi:hypothetical protein
MSAANPPIELLLGDLCNDQHAYHYNNEMEYMLLNWVTVYHSGPGSQGLYLSPTGHTMYVYYHLGCLSMCEEKSMPGNIGDTFHLLGLDGSNSIRGNLLVP